ncbi:ThiF family adenylyltransferase [Psychrobacillus sp. MER TA 171]|uniref:ThiF family adenylyltransferase n=1 Tax=Psychrobacillus sp. MER TA 171 TaxID=2939577 RepID=UPI00203BFFF1|nr:ThiF family adenylyltransferase [Psychrobacillus sp. MER TA 171]MCM3358016.1 ThiF family adenylyltransferase [Psychrobacillus sp. MER TA 171]
MTESIKIKDKAKSNYTPYKGVFYNILQIGSGGTGGYLAQHISQLIGVSKSQAKYVIADPDIIEEKNLGNQLFLEEEVGLKKADVLAARYSHAYDLRIGTYSEKYIESTKDIENLFSSEYYQYPYNQMRVKILIGAVDNNYSRKIMHQYFMENKPCIYIDAGNEAPKMPADWMNRPKNEWTKNEIEEFNASGWTGQVVTGVNFNLFKQDPVAKVFPDILEDTDELRPSELSCTDLTASEPQRLIVNKFAAMAITSILTEIIEEDTISSHMTVFHAKKSNMRCTPIKSSN